MMQSEFERRIGHPVPPTEWPAISRIYAYHPDINGVGSKDQIVQLYTTHGFRGLAHRMLAEANRAAAMGGVAPVHLEVDEWFGIHVIADDGRILETRSKTVGQVYTYLRTGLGHLIDEYFSISADPPLANGPDSPWPLDNRWIAVFPVSGTSEGTYIHVETIGPDRHSQLLFLAKTFRGMPHAWRIAQRLGELLHI
jgi:hypothetical protein